MFDPAFSFSGCCTAGDICRNEAVIALRGGDRNFARMRAAAALLYRLEGLEAFRRVHGRYPAKDA